MNLSTNATSSAEESIYFEPLLLQSLVHFSKLMEVYQAEEEEKEC